MQQRSESKVWRVIDLITWTTTYFQKQEIPSARLDAELLLANVLDMERLGLYLHFQDVVPPSKLDQYREYVRQRAERVPLAYLTQEREFMGLPLHVDPNVLIPRPETETLVEIVEQRHQGSAEILEIGTGSGAIAISLASRMGWRVTATDISPEALKVAMRNAERHEVEDKVCLLQGDLFQPLDTSAPFDWVLSNPPYIATDVLPTLAPEISHEPPIALDGGPDGLDIVRIILTEAPRYLKPGGGLLLEIGHDQAETLRQLTQANTAYQKVDILRDYSNAERFLLAYRA